MGDLSDGVPWQQDASATGISVMGCHGDGTPQQLGTTVMGCHSKRMPQQPGAVVVVASWQEGHHGNWSTTAMGGTTATEMGALATGGYGHRSGGRSHRRAGDHGGGHTGTPVPGLQAGVPGLGAEMTDRAGSP